MEFERSLFRVHERIVSGIPVAASTQNHASFSVLMGLFLTLGALSFSLLIALHLSFAGDGTCLAQALKHEGFNPRIWDVNAFGNMSDDASMIFSDDVIRLWAMPVDGVSREPTSLSSVWQLEDVMRTTDVVGDKNVEESSQSTKPDYEFSADPAFLLIDENLREPHSVKVINIAFDPACYGFWWRSSLSRHFISSHMDEIVINQFMFGFENSEGVLRSQSSHETWSWTSDVRIIRDQAFPMRLLINIHVLWRVCGMFMLVSSMVALVVRTLLSSGVAILFPFIYVLNHYRLLHSDAFRWLTMSYPWIGGDVEVLQATGQSVGPLVRAHMLNVVVTYAAVEACQFAWRRWIMGFKPHPAGLEVFIFVFVMVCEYYLLLFARSPTTLRYLPRLIALSFVLFLQYAFAVPYGFVSVAGYLLLFWTVFWMVWFLVKCETKALRRGTVSLESPRAFYTLLASPQWPIALPPHWSIFHELNRVQRSVYEDHPDVQGDVEQGIGAREPTIVANSEQRSPRRTDDAHPESSVASGLAHRRSRRSENQGPPLILHPPMSLSSPSSDTS